MQNNELFPAFEYNNVPVVISSSNMYAPYAGVFIQSLLDCASDNNNYDIIVFEREISNENKRLLKNLGTNYKNIVIRFYDPSVLFQKYSIDQKGCTYPLESYYSLIAPHILRNYDKIVVVDIDTLLKADIAGVLNTDLKDYSVGGVYDVIANGYCINSHWLFSGNVAAVEHFKKICRLEDMHYYVNGGLLLFDCNKYVQQLSIETILDTVQNKKFTLVDQDTLNYLMLKRIKPLDFAWNVQLPLNKRIQGDIEAGAKIYEGAYERSYENPYLLHWAGKPKPWVCPDVPFGSEWWQTALRTPFIGQIIVRMADEQERRRTYYRKRYGIETVDIWEPSPRNASRK